MKVDGLSLTKRRYSSLVTIPSFSALNVQLLVYSILITESGNFFCSKFQEEIFDPIPEFHSHRLKTVD